MFEKTNLTYKEFCKLNNIIRRLAYSTNITIEADSYKMEWIRTNSLYHKHTSVEIDFRNELYVTPDKTKFVRIYNDKYDILLVNWNISILNLKENEDVVKIPLPMLQPLIRKFYELDLNFLVEKIKSLSCGNNGIIYIGSTSQIFEKYNKQKEEWLNEKYGIYEENLKNE